LVGRTDIDVQVGRLPSVPRVISQGDGGDFNPIASGNGSKSSKLTTAVSSAG